MGDLERNRLRKVVILLFVLVLAETIVLQRANAALISENVRAWYWTGNTKVADVAAGDVDGDGFTEIVTGGTFNDGFRNVAQLCVWNGATLAIENVKTWYWTGSTYIQSVEIANVDGDANQEIVTGGSYYDGTRSVAQLCVWSGGTLALENVKTWYWSGDTEIFRAEAGNVDGDAETEIVTGGYYTDNGLTIAQLCVWNGATLTLENVKTWYWTSDTDIFALAIGNVDGDANQEIVTGGYFDDGIDLVAQLCVWNGETLALENVKTWRWQSGTAIYSLAVGNVDGDANQEIVTGGYAHDGNRYNAQLCVWSGGTLALENVKTWYWSGDTEIDDVAIENVDGDANMEIVTGGYYTSGSLDVAQLCVWNGATLNLENLITYYWTDDTFINAVATSNVDGDANMEIVAAGAFYDGIRVVSMLCVWA